MRHERDPGEAVDCQSASRFIVVVHHCERPATIDGRACVTGQTEADKESAVLAEEEIAAEILEHEGILETPGIEVRQTSLRKCPGRRDPFVGVRTMISLFTCRRCDSVSVASKKMRYVPGDTVNDAAP